LRNSKLQHIKRSDQVASSNRPRHFDMIPVELHGHRKKLDFIWSSIEQFRLNTGSPTTGVRVLEIGCSNGINVAIPLAKCGYQVTGIDLHAESIEYAKNHIAEISARFLHQNLSDLEDLERFEIIVLSDVLEHVEDPFDLCSMAIRHLVPDGLVLISIPNGYGPYELEQRFISKTHLDSLLGFVRKLINCLLARQQIVGVAYNTDSGHIQFFHLRDFHNLLDRVGLSVQKMKNGAFFGGTITYGLFNRIPFCAAGSLSLANWLPSRWVSTWYFCCVLKKPSAFNSAQE
jgi:2-polyprenyl-3-methyl-5-hydroxy-6-metoxy-1,4-benzoquinol methylase